MCVPLFKLSSLRQTYFVPSYLAAFNLRAAIARLTLGRPVTTPSRYHFGNANVSSRECFYGSLAISTPSVREFAGVSHTGDSTGADGERYFFPRDGRKVSMHTLLLSWHARFVKFATHLEVSGKLSIAGARSIHRSATPLSVAGELLLFSRASNTSTGNFQSGR